LIPAGEDALDLVVEEVSKADLLVFVVPEHEGEGKNALMELGMAKAKGKPIVPVVLDESRIANSRVATTLSGTGYLYAGGIQSSDIGRMIMAAVAAVPAGA
jgi:nucleoside 2-deoxyribosyltransferase